MGIMDAIGKAMSSLLSSQAKAGEAAWVERITMEEIEEMEAKGCDMSEYRVKYEEREARKAAEIKRRLEAIDYSLLDNYRSTPRDLESDFVKDVASFSDGFFFNKENLADATIVYGAVVQAHFGLWEPGEYGSMAAVFVFAMDEKHIYDVDWLLNTAEKISEMKNSSNVPEDCKKFIATLRDDKSIFCFKLGESLSGDADAWCCTYAFKDQTKLPDTYLPQNKILPFILMKKPHDKTWEVDIALIPAKYYNK